MTSRDLPVYWINLDHSLTRKHNTIKQLEDHNVKQHFRVPAVEPSQLGNYDISKPAMQHLLLPAEWCCTLSHLKAIWTALQHCQDTALIIEDDVNIIRCPSHADAWRAIVGSLGTREWHILQMAPFGDIAVDLLTDDQAPLWIPWRSGIWSTCAYIINRRGMVNMLQRYAPSLLTSKEWGVTRHHVNFSDMPVSDDPRARAVADWALYVAVITWTCTDVFFTEAGQDSTIKVLELPLHQKTIQAISNVVQKKQYKLALT